MHVADSGEHLPGDRYPVVVPAEPGGDGREVEQMCALGVVPYTFTFRAPVKGRWLGRPLLNVFAKEFAYIAPLTATGGDGAPQASLDPRVTIPAYVEELRSGALCVHGREAESRAAGHAYAAELHHLLAPAVEANNNSSEGGSSSGSNNNNTDCGGGVEEKVKWRADIAAGSEAAAMEVLLGALQPRLLLRQKDVILHEVLRREAAMPCGDPLHILRYDHAPRGVPPRRLLIVQKPHGVPVHPSGRCRKNSVTAILEDVFGGVDAHRYHAVPLDEQQQQQRRRQDEAEERRVSGVEHIAIRHKRYGFELIRVWVGDGYVSREAWAELHSLLTEQHVSGLKAFVVHRLDAATSGVLLFGLDSASARVTTELLAQKGDAEADSSDLNGETAAAVGCTKQYLARVLGRFDAAKLAQEQHHCSLALPPSVSATPAALDEGRDASWLRVDRPIGCLSYHDSLYWCPDAALTQSWCEDMEASRRRSDTACVPDVKSTVSGARKRAPHRDAAALVAKHERMRQLTIGGRAAAATNSDGVGNGCDCGGGGGDNGERDSNNAAEAQTRRLKESMKRAVTLVRCVAYDAARDESVVECLLLTGRTHQVRVHLASLGHPIRGDAKYIRHASAAVAGSSAAAWGAVDGFDEGLLSRAIFLHAWRYTLRFAASDAPELLEAQSPAWAVVEPAATPCGGTS